MHRVEVEQIIEASPEAVWDRYTDHVGWSDWARLGRVRLEREGSPSPNGVGAVRVFQVGPGVYEEVTAFEPPRRMTYRLVRGAFPITNHSGEVLFESHPRGTRVIWRCQFDPRVPLTGGVIERALSRLFRTVLDRFARRGLRAA